MRESNVVHISAPVTVVGDIHGCVCNIPSSLIATVEQTRLLIRSLKPVLRPYRDLSHRWIRPPHKLLVPRFELMRLSVQLSSPYT
jgi:hypothetical protein